MLRRNKAAAAYKLKPANKLSARWKRAKLIYFTEAERKRPKVTKELTLFGKKIGTYKTRATGIEQALKTIETTIGPAYTSDAARAKFNTARTKFSTEKLRFGVEVSKVAADAPEGVDKPKLTRAAKNIKDELVKLDQEIAKEINKLEHFRGETQTFTVLSTKVAKGLRLASGKALVFIDAVRDDPQPAVFNAKCMTTARDITQELNTIRRLNEMGYDFPAEIPEDAFEALQRWGNQGRKLDEGADARAVNRELDEFQEAVETVARWVATL